MFTIIEACDVGGRHTVIISLQSTFEVVIALLCRRVCRDTRTGSTSEQHPLDSYFLELIRRRRRELMRRKKAAMKAALALAKMKGRKGNLFAKPAGGGAGADAAAATSGEGEGPAAWDDWLCKGSFVSRSSSVRSSPQLDWES